MDDGELAMDLIAFLAAVVMVLVTAVLLGFAVDAFIEATAETLVEQASGPED